VVVEGRRIGDYVLVQIEDRGLGIAADQMHMINERLAEPPTVDASAFRMMGLAVVSRLASRYRIKVELRANPDGGTITGITLPTNILVLPRLRGREPVIARPRQPLAVEAGPTGFASRPMPQLPGLAPASIPTGVITAPRPGYDEPVFEQPQPRTTFEVPLARPVETFGYQVAPAQPVASAPPAPPVQPAPPARRGPDDTTEMPIFRSMEAVWFRGNEAPQGEPLRSVPTPRTSPTPRTGPTARTGSTPPRTSPVPPASTYVPPAAAPPPVPPAGPPPANDPPTRYRTSGPPSGAPSEEGWRTSADVGWRAAAAAATPKDGGTTKSGLPKRVPAAQLVPGAVDARTTARAKRTPDEVRGLLSAYHRGVQRGRTGGEGPSLGRSDSEERH
jgi:hypothetical protein